MRKINNRFINDKRDPSTEERSYSNLRIVSRPEQAERAEPVFRNLFAWKRGRDTLHVIVIRSPIVSRRMTQTMTDSSSSVKKLEHAVVKG